jgi:hypothetical protein
MRPDVFFRRVHLFFLILLLIILAIVVLRPDSLDWVDALLDHLSPVVGMRALVGIWSILLAGIGIATIKAWPTPYRWYFASMFGTLALLFFAIILSLQTQSAAADALLLVAGLAVVFRTVAIRVWPPQRNGQ